MYNIPCLACFVSSSDQQLINAIDAKRARRRRGYAWVLVSLGLFVFLITYLQDMPKSETCFVKKVGQNVYTSIYIALFCLFIFSVAGYETFFHFLDKETLGTEGWKHPSFPLLALRVGMIVSFIAFTAVVCAGIILMVSKPCYAVGRRHGPDNVVCRRVGVQSVSTPTQTRSTTCWAS